MPRVSACGRPAEVRTHATSSHVLMQNLACNWLLLGETRGFGNRSTSQAALSSPTCPCCLTARKNVHTSFSCRWRFRSDLQSYNPPSFEKRSGPGRYLCELMAEQPRPSTCNSNGNSNSKACCQFWHVSQHSMDFPLILASGTFVAVRLTADLRSVFNRSTSVTPGMGPPQPLQC